MHLNNNKIVFVVGNSRSGTTMMGRVLGNSKNIFTFGELHFYGFLYDPLKDRRQEVTYNEAVELFSKLLCLQRCGFFSNFDNLTDYKDEVCNVLKQSETYTFENVYLEFLLYETKHNKKQIPCEQTPKNLFFLNYIFELPIDVRVINMVRDPRDILSSQKNKWKRRFLGACGIPMQEAIRAWFNYHPITIAVIWRSAIQEFIKYERDHHRILTVKFEQFLKTPEDELQNICEFLEIEYDSDMLYVPKIGSSEGQDSSEKGINKTRINPWRNSKNMTNTEIYLCEKICAKEMEYLSYKSSGYQPNLFLLMYYYLQFPFKMFVALLLNLKRTKNLTGTIHKYFLNKKNVS